MRRYIREHQRIYQYPLVLWGLYKMLYFLFFTFVIFPIRKPLVSKKIFLTIKLSPISLSHTENIARNCQLAHLTCNSLHNPFQSAYNRNYFTETTLLSLHDHLSNVISHQVSCLCLLDLFAAFDTFYHSILLHRFFR